MINETLVILCFTLSIESNSCTLFDSLIIYSYFLLLLFHTRFFSYNAILCQLTSNLDNPPLFHSNRFRITCVTKHTTKDWIASTWRPRRPKKTQVVFSVLLAVVGSPTFAEPPRGWTRCHLNYLLTYLYKVVFLVCGRGKYFVVCLHCFHQISGLKAISEALHHVIVRC